MLERVLEFPVVPRLVEELGRLQAIESTPQRLVRQLGDRLQQQERHILADDGGRLEQAFVLREEPIDARRQDRLDGSRALNRLDWLRQAMPAAFPRQGARLHQRADSLFQEERVPAPDQELLEWLEPGVVTEKRLQQLLGTLRREGV